MKVGVLGSGDVAKALAGGFLKHGHAVKMGSRMPAKLTDWVKQHPKGQVGSFADAARFGELVVLAVKGTVAADVSMCCRHSESCREARDRCYESDYGRAAEEWRVEVLHESG